MKEYNFFQDFRTNVIGQYDECAAYKLLCNSQNYDPIKELKVEKDIENVPFITTTLFKKSAKMYRNLLRIEPKNLEKWTTSSSTSGDPSIVGRTNEDILQIKKFIQLQQRTLDSSNQYNCVFYPEPEVMMKHKSIQILDKPTESFIGNMLRLYPFSKNTNFLLHPYKGEFSINTKQFVEFLNEHNKKNQRVSLRGSTLLLYNAVESLKDKMKPFELGQNCTVQTCGGGWDGKKGNVNLGTKMERSKFVEEISNFLGIPEENFIDSYSFTENTFPINGHYSKKYKNYLFHVPSWGRIIIRDIKTLEPLHNEGERGFIQMLNAYGTSSFAGASLLVDDIGEIVSEKRCPVCGTETMTIKIIGRVKGAEAKGCGATLDVKEIEKI
ncbi:acyl-protein synthetase [Clostridium felsineum]|uniref:LuxE/PaaK family acyltransferase n=1 Tax=Clostridium felsineum TaxID=36839 RepID=UPI00214DC18C|nr:acyl-protein synthetase [Clostridium felsineum]MCR3761147.1 acyl-protein synthetase [Clostridium felsineum]